MGYRVKLQKVQRPTNRSYYLNVPTALAEAMQVHKGEEFEWILEDRNTLVLRRLRPLPSVRSKQRATKNAISDEENGQH
jgi:hypothetical protein